MMGAPAFQHFDVEEDSRAFVRYPRHGVHAFLPAIDDQRVGSSRSGGPSTSPGSLELSAAQPAQIAASANNPAAYPDRESTLGSNMMGVTGGPSVGSLERGRKLVPRLALARDQR
jgi:hypothetical protein